MKNRYLLDEGTGKIYAVTTQIFYEKSRYFELYEYFDNGM